eukprot:gb/GFBE01025613.1/.p1 GENE.gb/GFBE01025613.1/~~gb/GFBE01025613.1/.p1  ORF type:complete len:107 (+),score=17.55 gb/GFBE01025613.1/:1-321(+)
MTSGAAPEKPPAGLRAVKKDEDKKWEDEIKRALTTPRGSNLISRLATEARSVHVRNQVMLTAAEKGLPVKRAPHQRLLRSSTYMSGGSSEKASEPPETQHRSSTIA